MKVLEELGRADPGIKPVDDSSKVLGGLDQAVLWGDLGVGILVLVTGALLVPGLGFGQAMVAIVLGSAIGVALLAAGAVAGADHGVPTMVLFRPALGIRGSWAPSVLNAMQLIGWTAVELWAMSIVADLVVEKAFGFSARWLWLGLATLICTGLALWGPVGVARDYMKRYGAFVVGALMLLLTILVLTDDRISGVLTWRGAGGFPSMGLALDFVIAMPVSWLPLVADYSRFSRGPRSAGGGTFVGYALANVWIYALGALLVLVAGTTPDPSGIALGVDDIAGGLFAGAGLLFLLGLLVVETDEGFADMYSAGVSIQNVLPKLALPKAIIGVALVSVVLAAIFTMSLYESFLFLIGSVFVPLFGVLLADHFVRRRRRVQIDDLYEKDGKYWFSGGFNWTAFLPWAVGFVAYHWIAPTGPAWWINSLSTGIGSIGEKVQWLPASVPSFALAFGLTLILPSPRRRDVSSAVPSHLEKGHDEDPG